MMTTMPTMPVHPATMSRFKRNSARCWKPSHSFSRWWRAFGTWSGSASRSTNWLG